METSKCQVCGSPVEKGVRATLCPECETPHHPECWEYNGGCTTYACKEAPGTRNAPVRQRPEVYIDEPARQQPHRPERRGGGRPLPAAGFASQVLAFLGNLFLVIFGLIMLAGFIVGFIDGLTSSQRRPARRAHRVIDRAFHLRGGDRAAHLRELAAMAVEKRCTEEELRLVNSLFNWSPDAAVREAALKAAVAVAGHEEAVQDLLVLAMRSPDPSIRRAASVRLLKLGPVTSAQVDVLADILTGPEGPAEDAMALLEGLRPSARSLAHHVGQKRIPGPLRNRLAMLAGSAAP